MFSMGCSVCSEVGGTSFFARFAIVLRGDVYPHLLKKHAASVEHTKAAAGQSSAVARGAPTAAQFKKVATTPTGTFDDLGPKKQRAMVWCLSEAKRDKERKLVRCAASTLYSQDASDGKLLNRVSISTTSLENYRFIIGWLPLMGTDSFAILETTKQAVDAWATPRARKPTYGTAFYSSSPVLPLDEVAKSSLLESIQAVVTDAASDEFRCVRLASGSSESAFVSDTLMPNLIIHGRDPTHASGRFLKARRLSVSELAQRNV